MPVLQDGAARSDVVAQVNKKPAARWVMGGVAMGESAGPPFGGVCVRVWVGGSSHFVLGKLIGVSIM